MSNKRKLTTILAVAGATVLAAGGSAFVTNAGLSVVDPDASKSQGSEVAINEKETELPMTVEKFAATKDSFTVKPQSDSDKKNGKNSDKNEESEQETDSTDGSTRSDSTTGDGSSTGSGASTDFSSSQYYSADGKFYNESEGGYYDDNGLYHDQWGGLLLLMEHIMMDRVVTGMAMAITAPDLEAAPREAVHPEAAPREAVHLEEVLLVLRSMTAVEALQAAVRQEAIQELMMTAI